MTHRTSNPFVQQRKCHHIVPQNPVQKDVYAKGKEDISIDGTAVKAGDVLTYEINYTNFTNQTQNDLVITDKIPVETSYVDGSASEEGFVSFENGILKWKVDELKANESITVSFSVTITETKANTKLKNVAISTHGNDPTDPDVPKKSNEVTVEYVPTSAPKTGDSSPIAIWSTLAFASLMVCGALLVIEKKRRNEI